LNLSDNLRVTLAERARRFDELTALLGDPAVLSDGRQAARLARERGALERIALLQAEVVRLERERREAEALLGDSTADADFRAMAREELDDLTARENELLERVRDELVRDSDLERRRVIVEVRAGTGGDEATLFARDLYQMYERFAQGRGWRLEVLDVSASEVGGLKEAVFALEGDGVWNLMRFESGGHRVQRVPATESKGRIHTSAATVAVLPEAEEAEIEIGDGDLRIDTMRAGGPGGQSVNTTSSAVRITHLPTGLAVHCQDEKSQLKNKQKAMRILRARLLEAEQNRLHEERAKERREQVGSGNRNDRIRTYNWPQNRVSDDRLDANYSLEQVVGGRLGTLLEALVARDREERLARL